MSVKYKPTWIIRIFICLGWVDYPPSLQLNDIGVYILSRLERSNGDSRRDLYFYVPCIGTVVIIVDNCVLLLGWGWAVGRIMTWALQIVCSENCVSKMSWEEWNQYINKLTLSTMGTDTLKGSIDIHICASLARGTKHGFGDTRLLVPAVLSLKSRGRNARNATNFGPLSLKDVTQLP